MSNKQWTEQDIIDLLNQEGDKGAAAVTRAVIAIYNRQTEDEKIVGDTRIHNNIGFNGADAKYLSFCASYAINTKKSLNGKHLDKAKSKIIKYRKQLLQIANGE
jgi:hypothetical protein